MVLGLFFFTLHLLFPYSFWTFIPHSSLDFYFPFLFRLFSFLFHFFYQLVFNSLLILFFFFFISFSILLLFNLGHILDFFQIFNNEKYFWNFLIYYSLFQENPIICWTWLNLWSIPGDFLPTGSMLLRLFTVLENLRRWPSLHFWPLLGLMKTLLIPLSKVKWNHFGH